MSHEKNELPLIALLSIVPVILLFAADFNIMMLQFSPETEQGAGISHFAFAVLIAQLIYWVAFRFGELCPGQRGRLTVVNLCWLGFWAAWLWLNTQIQFDFMLTLLNLSGIVLTLASSSQSKDAGKRKPLLMLAGIAAGVAMSVYLLMLYQQPVGDDILSYNLLSQTFTGIILAYLALVISRNRLQEFIALLPVGFIGLLVLNAVIVLGFLAVIHFSDNRTLQADIAVYFVMHLVLMAVFMYPIWRKTKLTYSPLLFALCVAIGLPFFI